MKTELGNGRILVIDLARFFAIALVFYGHFIEELMLLKNPAAAAQYKFVYSFHMVLFIVLAGYVAKESHTQWPLAQFLKDRFFSRLLPFVFFNLVMMVPPVFFEGKLFDLGLPSMDGYVKGLVNTVFGLPFFCVPSWFILLIIGVELVHYTAFRFLKDSDAKILWAAVLFYVAGYLLNLRLDIFNPLRGRTIGWNYFFIHEALTLYAFYLAGLFLRRKGVFTRPMAKKILIPGILAAFILVLLTYDLNKGPFNFHVYDAVVILFASHGHMLLFPLTASAGCALVLLIARLTRPLNTLVWMGQNTLILMCLNGIFYHYINPPAARWVLAHLPQSAPAVLGAGLAVTVASLIMCMPLVFLLDKFLPQLTGKPKRRGPVLKNLI